MFRIKLFGAIIAAAILVVTWPSNAMAACDKTNYAKLYFAGLCTLRGYPTRSDVCKSLKVTANISKYKRKGFRLIACPRHERGAVRDRVKEGALVVGRGGKWSVLRIPVSKYRR